MVQPNQIQLSNLNDPTAVAQQLATMKGGQPWTEQELDEFKQAYQTAVRNPMHTQTEPSLGRSATGGSSI